MHELFNDYIQSLETYIMFSIKETVARITPELKEKYYIELPKIVVRQDALDGTIKCEI
mgnify:CR=1 FL=1